MKKLNEIIALNIANLRKAKGLTQQELAERFDYSDKTVSKWELGQAIPSLEVLKQLGDYFGVTVDYFLHEDSEIDKTKFRIKSIPQKQNEILITALSAVSVCLLCTVVFVYSIFNTELFPTPYWQSFIWMIPFASFTSLLFVFRWFRSNKVLRIILMSTFIWGLLASIYIHAFTFPYINPSANIWYIFFIGIPLEVMIILINQMRK